MQQNSVRPGWKASVSLTTVFILFFTLMSASVRGPLQAAHASTTGGTLIWSDDFNGSTVDTSKWTVHDGGPSFTGKDWTTANNVSVQNNIMTLKVDKVAIGGKSYTSAWVDTLGKFAFLYGRVEIRAQMPQGGAGIWPALWTQASTTYWPPEIDLWDNSADMSTMVGRNIYGPDSSHTYQQNFSHGGVTPGYHVFAFDWEPGSLTYLLDGNVIQTMTAHIPSTPQYLQMDIVTGWNSPTSSTVFPQYLNVNYVQVYQNSTAVTGNVEKNLLKNPDFEDDAPNPVQTPSGWFTTGEVSASSVESQNCDCGREWNLKHFSSSAYQVYTGQTVTGLTNGLYAATADVSSSGGQKSVYMEVKDDGSSAMQVSIPTSSSAMRVAITAIPVTNGQATIGFYSNANAGNWLRVDNVRFFLQSSIPNQLGDAGFEEQTGNAVSAPWGTLGSAGTVGIDYHNGKAHTGQNDAYVGNGATGNWSEINQYITLQGYTSYALSCWIRTVGSASWPGGYIGIITADRSVQYSQFFGSEANYTHVTMPVFTTGSNIDWKVFIGYHRGLNTWAQIDDCSLTIQP